jgi:hypothetical protein
LAGCDAGGFPAGLPTGILLPVGWLGFFPEGDGLLGAAMVLPKKMNHENPKDEIPKKTNSEK